MQAMLDEVAPKLKIGVRMLSETARADARARATLVCSSVRPRPILRSRFGSSPFFNPQQHECGGRRRWWTILAFVPLVNLIGLWVFAFTRWPSRALAVGQRVTSIATNFGFAMRCRPNGIG
jgi:hypothetical protein